MYYIYIFVQSRTNSYTILFYRLTDFFLLLDVRVDTVFKNIITVEYTCKLKNISSLTIYLLFTATRNILLRE